jgi:SAM-dependent methyltransferase
MDLERLAALRSPRGRAALAAAADVVGLDPIRAGDRLRKAGFPADLAASALTQVELRQRAVAKFGEAAAVMYFTRAGLEQATRAAVAQRRADRLRANGVGTLLDLGCGLGADAIAGARAGLQVTAVEADPLTAAMAAANAEALGLTDRLRVVTGQAEAQSPAAFDAVFADPARRGAVGRVFAPAAYSPPWSFVAGLPAINPRTVLKLAPGFPHEQIPAGAEAQWISVGGELVELTIWCGPFAAVRHRATVLGSSTGAAEAELTGTGTATAPVAGVGAVLYDTDPAVIRSHLVAEFAATVSGRLADPTIAYVYADSLVTTPFARAHHVHDVLPFSVKRLKRILRDRQVGQLTIKKRGSALLPEDLRRQLKPVGPHAATVVLTRVAGAPTMLLCR